MFVVGVLAVVVPGPAGVAVALIVLRSAAPAGLVPTDAVVPVAGPIMLLTLVPGAGRGGLGVSACEDVDVADLMLPRPLDADDVRDNGRSGWTKTSLDKRREAADKRRVGPTGVFRRFWESNCDLSSRKNVCHVKLVRHPR